MSYLPSVCKLSLLRCIAAATALLATVPGAHAAADDMYETVNAGSPIGFSVVAEGTPAPGFQWMKDGVNIPGATSNTFQIPVASTKHQGVYNVLATNSAGWALSHDLILTVKAISNDIAPSFTLQPYPTASASVGSSLTLSAEAVGTPTPTYQWRFNGTPIPGATQASLNFPSLSTSHSGNYSVVATNSAGSATSNNSILKVTSPLPQTNPEPAVSAPVFTLHPDPASSATVGSSLTLSAAAVGTPAPTYQWRFNGTPIPGATQSLLNFPSLNGSHSGNYSVVATNSAGSVTSNNAILKVTAPAPVTNPYPETNPVPETHPEPESYPQPETNPQPETYPQPETNPEPAVLQPVFTLQPAHQIGTLKGSVQFEAHASGDPVYQWYKDGQAIAGATSSWYSIPVLTNSHAGTYTVVATNSAGSVTSQHAYLETVVR